MKVLCEATWIDTEGEEPRTMRGQYNLLHFGLAFRLIDTENGVVPVNYTVCICENIKTGNLEKFDPEQIKILGHELKK